MAEMTIDELRQQAIEQGLSYGVTRLREQYHMKPKPDAEPVRWLKSPYSRQKNPVYLVADCVPIKVRHTAASSEAQKLGRQIAGLKAKLRSKAYAHSQRVNAWLSEKWADLVVLDTETTGLESADQIIELAIINMAGETLFNQRFKPTVKIHPQAEAVHGISENELANCPSWPAYQKQITEILADKTAIIFNREFDLRMMKQTANAFNGDTAWLAFFDVNAYCAMKTAVAAFGASNRHGTISLAIAADEAGLSWQGQAHNALADCDMTRRLILAIADRHKPVLDQLKKAEEQKAQLRT